MIHKHIFSSALVAAIGLMPLTQSNPATLPNALAPMSGVPAGTILSFAGDVIPPGYLLCDGTEVLRSDYPRLYTAIGESWGATTNFTFTLPDLRGRFLRGVDGTANNDPDHNFRVAINPGGNVGDLVGSAQDEGRRGFSGVFGGTTSTAGAHDHTFPTYNDDYDEDDGNGSLHNPGWADDRPNTSSAQSNITSYAGAHSHTFSVNVTFNGDHETRPKNAYVNYIVKW